MTTLPRLTSRNDIREILGQGGMGIVYKAYDPVIRSEVALKTLRDVPDPAALETFQKALRNEDLKIFDVSRIQPRIQRATKAFEQQDYQFADEILAELEAEGHLDPAITALHRQINQKVRHLLHNARTRIEQQEFPLALQKLHEVLQLEPDNAEALGLKNQLETQCTVEKVEDWLRLARQHIGSYAS